MGSSRVRIIIDVIFGSDLLICGDFFHFADQELKKKFDLELLRARSVSLDRPCNSDLLVRFLIEPIRCEFKFFGSGNG